MHIRVHTNERPYPCPYKDKCNQSFKTRSQLNDHILKHTQIKKHVCPECKASFSRKSRLKIHLMIHKGEKPFQCEICKKQFREKSNYNYHLKKHDNLSAIKNKEKNKNVFCKYEFKRIHKGSDNFNTTKSNSNNSIESKKSKKSKNKISHNEKRKKLLTKLLKKDTYKYTNLLNKFEKWIDFTYNSKRKKRKGRKEKRRRKENERSD